MASSLLTSFAYRGCLLKSKANAGVGDPCPSFSSTKSSGPRGVKEIIFSFDPLPKRTKRTVAASSDKNRYVKVPEKRREPPKADADVKEVKVSVLQKGV